MTRVRRLTALLAALVGIAVLSSASSWGDNTKQAERGALLPRDSIKPASPEVKAVADAETALARSKFAEAPLLTYQPTAGDPYFALQVKPKLTAGPRRPVSRAGITLVSLKTRRSPGCISAGRSEIRRSSNPPDAGITNSRAASRGSHGRNAIRSRGRS